MYFHFGKYFSRQQAFISGATSGEMYVNQSIPPYTGDNIIVERTYWNPAESRWTLYVPKGCKSVYAVKAPWNKFKSIIEDDSLDGTGGFGGSGGSGDAVHFPDANFKAYMVANFDLNKDGEISKDEASLITRIKCRDRNIQSLEGIEYCTALTDLDCSWNQLTTLDVSKTNLGNSTEHSPLFCDDMPTLQTLYLKTGWKIYGINVNRTIDCIPEQTKIRYKD